MKLLVVAGYSSLLLACPCASLASQRQVLHGHLPAALANVQPVGRLAGTDRLDLALGLPLRNQGALTNLLRQLYDPASPRYHHYLTPAQFTEQFGPTAEDYQAVTDFAEAHGLKVLAKQPGRMVLPVQGTVADIERAFHVNLRLYPHPKEKRNFFAPDIEPSLDLAVPVLTISGINNYVVPRPLLHVNPSPGSGGGATPHAGSGPGGNYLANDLRAAYVPGVTLTGAGQSVALVEFDGYYPTDIAAYENLAGLSNVNVVAIQVDGASGIPGPQNDEVALDIDMAIAMAPGLASVLVYEEPNPGNPNNLLGRIADDNLARQISASWGYPIDGTTEQIFQRFAAQGQSFFNSSGDSGAYTTSVSQPSDDPYITIVGGTTLSTTGPGGPWSSETTWNWYTSGRGSAGTGGGVSATYPLPAWQQGMDMSTNGGSASMRNLPDVAMIGDNVWVIWNNGHGGSISGTSVSAPLWAGFTALMNQQAAIGGEPSVGFINPAVYALGLGTNYTTLFHDITTGNNTNHSSPNSFFAVAGYDLCTGWGTPAGKSLIDALSPPVNRPVLTNTGFVLVSEGCIPPNGAIDPGETVTLSFGLQNQGGADTTNLVATLETNGAVHLASAPQTYGVLVGGGGPIVTRSFTFLADGTCGTTGTITLHLEDGVADLGTMNFSVQLGQAVTPLFESFDGVAAPSLPASWSTARSGGASNWITSTIARVSQPNAAYGPESAAPGIGELVSPVFQVTTPTAQLVFRQLYNLEADPVDTNKAYDGGVLELKIGNGSFTDVLSAGCIFAAGGYTRTVDPTDDNPLDGRQVWSGLSGGWKTTILNLPASAPGQNLQFKWRFGTDTENGYGGTGWYVDSVSVVDGYSCCSSSADLALVQNALPNPVALGGEMIYSLMVSNVGPSAAATVTVTDALPANVSFVSASPHGTELGGTITWALGPLPGGAVTNIFVVVKPLGLGMFTNGASLGSITPDPVSANNAALQVAAAILAPVVSGPILGGAGVSFSLASVVGVNYTLTYKNSLGDANWLPLVPAVPGTGGTITLQDTNGAAFTSRFYRVSCSSAF